MRIRRAFWLSLLLAAACATSRRPPPVSERPVGPPVFDWRKGWGSFPLAGDTTPGDPASLRNALEEGYRERLELAGDAPAVRLDGDRFESLRTLRVDVSGAKIRRQFTPSNFAAEPKVELEMHLEEVEYLADPLLFDGVPMFVRVWARNATLLVIRDKAGRASLVVGGAAEGVIESRIGAAELQQAFLAGLRRRAAKMAGSVSSASLRLSTPDPHTIDGEATISASVLLLPMELRLSGRMQVGEEFITAFTNVKCEGKDFGGGIAAPLVAGWMAKVERKVAPLMAFHDPETKVRSFALDASDGLRMHLEFGRGSAVSK